MFAFWRKKKKEDKKSAGEERGGEKKPGQRRTARRSSPLPFEMKLMAVEARQAGMEAGEIAGLMGVSTTTVQNWSREYLEGGERALCRKPALLAHRKICETIRDKIIEYRKAHPEHGVRRMQDELRRGDGIEVSAETIRSTVNEAGLGNPPPQYHKRPQELRCFEKPLPNACWQVDIFTFEIKRMYRVYLVAIIDDHSRFIVGWGLFRQQTAEAVMEVLKGSIGEWGAPREILSDNGRQFVAWRGRTRFQKVLRQQGIQHVRSAPHHPMTLGKIERFWRTIWEEFLSEAIFASFADACQRIGHWVSYYNHRRPHRGIDGQVPAARFYGLAEGVEEAVAQGCQDNSLRLALGQEPKPPLYLLGRLGGTDISVTRQGDDVVIKVGEAIHEVIRLGAPYTVDEDGVCRREGEADELEEDDGGGTLPGSGAGAQGQGADLGAERDVWGEPPGALPSDGAGGPGGDGGAGAAQARSQGQDEPGAEPGGLREGDGAGVEGAWPLEDEVRGGEGVHRPEPEDGEGRASSWGGGGGKKTPQTDSEDPWWDWEGPWVGRTR